MTSPWDVLVIGGGVVGSAIAREFAASGKRVLLCEKEDEVFLFCLTKLVKKRTRFPLLFDQTLQGKHLLR